MSPLRSRASRTEKFDSAHFDIFRRFPFGELRDRNRQPRFIFYANRSSVFLVRTDGRETLNDRSVPTALRDIGFVYDLQPEPSSALCAGIRVCPVDDDRRPRFEKRKCIPDPPHQKPEPHGCGGGFNSGNNHLFFPFVRPVRQVRSCQILPLFNRNALDFFLIAVYCYPCGHRSGWARLSLRWFEWHCARCLTRPFQSLHS